MERRSVITSRKQSLSESIAKRKAQAGKYTASQDSDRLHDHGNALFLAMLEQQQRKQTELERHS